MTRLPAKRRNKFFLDSYGRYMPKLDPEILNAATQVERNRIAALIELQEGREACSEKPARCRINSHFAGEWGTRPRGFYNKAKAKALNCP